MFARYRAERPPRPALQFEVRAAVPADAPAIAKLYAERNGRVLDEILPRVTRDLESGDIYVAVAVVRNVVAYARARWHDYETIPHGWYLAGVVVAPRYRRRGIAGALTRHRLEWLRERGAREVYYFANARNRASIALHERFGFREVRRDIVVPRVTFEGGAGVLYALAL